MPDQEVFVGDEGTTFVLEFEEDGVLLDISTATGLKVYLKSPSETKEREGVLVDGGVDGEMQYTAVDGDIDEAGDWEIQGELNIAGWRGRSSVKKFHVKDVL